MHDRVLTFICWPALALAAVLQLGCGDAIQPVVLEGPSVAPAADYTELAAVLAAAVDQGGYLRPEALGPLEGSLNVQLRRLAVTGPTVTPLLLPQPEDRLAYWYNARCAWSIELARLASFAQRMSPSRLELRPFPLDGRLMTLREIDAAIAKLAGWKALVAAPGLALDRAALPREAFGPGKMERRMDERLGAFIADRRRFRVDHRARRVLVPSVLWRFRVDLVETYQRRDGAEAATFITALLPHVEGAALRRLQDAVGYKALQAPQEESLAIVEPDSTSE